MHIPVLLKETIELLDPKEGEIWCDATVGLAGHAIEIAKRIGDNGRLLIIDRDASTIEIAKDKLSRNVETEILSFIGGFADIEKYMQKSNIKKLDGLLVDMGLSSYQLDESKRGFSYSRDEPLLMTFSSAKENNTAKEMLNEWSEQTLSDIFYAYADEKYSKKIAAAIVAFREEKKIETTYHLKEILLKAVPAPYTRGRKEYQYLSRNFQAIRMSVNDEFTQLKKMLSIQYKIVRKGGRIGYISFHSVEDRIIKKTIIEQEKEGLILRVNKKPIVPEDKEIKENSRSRSAKLRIVQIK